MSQRERETEFLRQLLVREETPEHRELRQQLVENASSLRCIRRASFQVVVLMMLCLSGIGYSAVFVPEFIEGRPHALLQFFYTLVLACLICLGGYCATWLLKTCQATRLQDRCRRALLDQIPTRDEVECALLGERRARQDAA